MVCDSAESLLSESLLSSSSSSLSPFLFPSPSVPLSLSLLHSFSDVAKSLLLHLPDRLKFT